VYWERCLRTYLPHHYTSNDTLRLSLAYFVISALDLLGALESSTTAAERNGWADWIYSLQLPNGGFRGAPATDLRDRRNAENEDYDPGNVPSTYFALATLLILGDNLERVKRRECLSWLRSMQREDGSFGAYGFFGEIEGGMDTRFGYTAMGIRWILRGRSSGEFEGVPDLNISKFVQCVRAANTYDGGMSEMPFHEGHAGFMYCAVSALSLASPFSGDLQTSGHPLQEGIVYPSMTFRWCASRQTTDFDDDDGEDTTSEGKPDESCLNGSEIEWIGINGRPNKIADTCYSWWVAGSLAVLGRLDLLNIGPNIRFLLDRTQHAIGGFAKCEGYPPDIYHSYLGLATLAVMGYEGLKPIHPAACISYDAVSHMDSLAWRRKIWDTPEPIPT
jgi:geranylgeranyl transferase type-1 subunit beta